MINYPPEDKELFYIQECLGYQLFPDSPIPIAQTGLDWEKLADLLERHHLAAYFFVLSSVFGTTWPIEFCEQLRKTNYKILLFNNSRSANIRQLLSKFCDSRVDIIILKGWAFIQTIYGGNKSVRFCIDIDVLVRPQDSTKAAGILMDLGYQPADESRPGYAERYLNAQAYSNINELTPLQIGFHWGLLHRPFYDPDQVGAKALFSRAQLLKVEGENVLELSIEDQIIYSCAHLGLHHKYDEALYRYYEIGFLIHRAGLNLDWQATTQRAQEWRCVIPLQRVLIILERLWPGLIPEDEFEEITQLSPVFMEHFVNWWIEKTKERPSFDHLLVWVTTPGVKRRFEIAIQDIFPSQEYMQKRYGRAPAGIWPLLYFKRLFHSFQMMRKSSNTNE